MLLPTSTKDDNDSADNDDDLINRSSVSIVSSQVANIANLLREDYDTKRAREHTIH